MLLRPLRASDFESVTELLHELGGGRPPLPAAPAERARVRAVYDAYLVRLAEERAIAFAAQLAEDGPLVGVLIADVRERLNQPRDECWVADLVVTESARGRGVGKALLDACRAEAKRLGLRRLSLESGHWRKDAHRFYEREGLTDAAKHFFVEL